MGRAPGRFWRDVAPPLAAFGAYPDCGKLVSVMLVPILEMPRDKTCPQEGASAMKARLDHFRAAPELMKAMVDLEKTVRGSGLEASLIDLVKLRASQINGCAYCIHMHSREARASGVDQDKLDLLPAWRESSFFSERERAALGWTEALTLVASTGAPDADYEALTAQFDEHDRVALSLAIGAINVWNRLAIGFRSQHPGKGQAGT